jgi:hypothetical protein
MLRHCLPEDNRIAVIVFERHRVPRFDAFKCDFLDSGEELFHGSALLRLYGSGDAAMGLPLSAQWGMYHSRRRKSKGTGTPEKAERGMRFAIRNSGPDTTS